MDVTTCILISTDPLVLVDEEDIREEAPDIKTNQLLDPIEGIIEQHKRPDNQVIYKQKFGMYNIELVL